MCKHIFLSPIFSMCLYVTFNIKHFQHNAGNASKLDPLYNKNKKPQQDYGEQKALMYLCE